MKKTFTANCASALLLRDREGTFAQYDSYAFNCAKMIMSEEISGIMAGRDINMNCASTKVIPTPQNPVYVNSRVTLSNGEDYAGKFLVCSSLVVTSQGVDALAGLEGLMVQGKTFLPKSMEGGNMPVGDMGEIAFYPDGARILFEELWLTQDTVLESNTQYFVSGRIFATDKKVLASMKERHISFICDRLYITDEELGQYGSIFTHSKLEVVPQGHAVIPKSMPLIDLYATAGDKVYLLEGISIRPDDVRHLSLFSSIVAKGKAVVPMENLAQVKGVVKAGSFKVYEGVPLQGEGVLIIGHEMLQEALKQGITYWVEAEGILLFQDDVSAQDVMAINSIMANGLILAPNATHARIKAVTRSFEGLMLPGLSELTSMTNIIPEGIRNKLLGMLPDGVKKLLGFEEEEAEEDAFTINCASYVLV